MLSGSCAKADKLSARSSRTGHTVSNGRNRAAARASALSSPPLDASRALLIAIRNSVTDILPLSFVIDSPLLFRRPQTRSVFLRTPDLVQPSLGQKPSRNIGVPMRQ